MFPPTIFNDAHCVVCCEILIVILAAFRATDAFRHSRIGFTIFDVWLGYSFKTTSFPNRTGLRVLVRPRGSMGGGGMPNCNAPPSFPTFACAPHSSWLLLQGIPVRPAGTARRSAHPIRTRHPCPRKHVQKTGYPHYGAPALRPWVWVGIAGLAPRGLSTLLLRGIPLCPAGTARRSAHPIRTRRPSKHNHTLRTRYPPLWCARLAPLGLGRERRPCTPAYPCHSCLPGHGCVPLDEIYLTVPRVPGTTSPRVTLAYSCFKIFDIWSGYSFSTQVGGQGT